jgi:AcrR family transcriptional regulator
MEISPMEMQSKEAVVEAFRVRTIQEAALRVISRKGIAGATMQEIADEAHMAKGTLYLYFKNRDELIENTVELACVQLVERLHAVLAEPRPLVEQLRAMVQTKFAFFDTHREFFRIYMALRYPTEEGRQAARARRLQRPQYTTHLEQLTAFFRRAIERGEMRDVDPGRVALFVAEGLTGVILARLTSESPPPTEADVDWIVKMLLDGLACRPSEAK